MAKKPDPVDKLFKPAQIANWTRHNFRRQDDTTRGLLKFVTNPPRHSLTQVYDVCRELAFKALSLDEALEKIKGINHPISRAAGLEIIPEFFNYLYQNNVEAIPELRDYERALVIGHYQDKALLVPIKPTVITLKNGLLRPLFLIGWARLAFNEYQRRLYTSVIAQQILSEQDFMNSDCDIVCIPRHKRFPFRNRITWTARANGTLSKEELADQFTRYGRALKDVITTLKKDSD